MRFEFLPPLPSARQERRCALAFCQSVSPDELLICSFRYKRWPSPIFNKEYDDANTTSIPLVR
jgi:hypothetical protein